MGDEGVQDKSGLLREIALGSEPSPSAHGCLTLCNLHKSFYFKKMFNSYLFLR